MYTEENNVRAVYLPIESIRPNPYQPRREMDIDALEDLCASIKQYGLMQPVVVRQINQCDYELIAGERRLRACRMAGLSQISAVVVRVGGTDSAVMALVENIQRENLGYIEEAEAFCTLLSEHGITQEELSARLGKSQSTIANKIRILKLSPEIRQKLSENNLSERHARALLRLCDEKSRIKALNIIISRGLNVTKSEELVDGMLNKNRADEVDKKTYGIRAFRDIRIFSNTIRQAVDIMKKSGIAARTTEVENEDYIEYTIKIPKNLKNAV
jgi:ParB family chromosome partitioning protein